MVVDDLLIAELVKAGEKVAGRMKVDLFVSPTGSVTAFGVLRAANARAGQTEVVITVKKKRGRGGRTDCVTERSSSTQLLLFFVTETILSPA